MELNAECSNECNYKNLSHILLTTVILETQVWCSISATRTSAVSPAAVKFVAIVTHTAEHPWKVLAGSKHTDVLEITLINVCQGNSEREKC